MLFLFFTVLFIFFFFFNYFLFYLFFFFFFSSRRRHTRWNCDWSSDVCSSDLRRQGPWHSGVHGVPWPGRRRQPRPRLSGPGRPAGRLRPASPGGIPRRHDHAEGPAPRSEEHTSELQSQFHLVCRLLLEKKKKK